MITKTAILIGMLAALGACGAAQSAKTGEALDESIRVYNEGMRWARFDTAAARIPALERAAFVDDWDLRSKDVKITDYDVVNVVHKGKEAQVQIKLSWYSEAEGTLHETSATQVWEQHGPAWFMVDETRLRGPEMPGLPNTSERSKRDAKIKADKAAKAAHALKPADDSTGIDAKVGLTDAPTDRTP